MPRVRKWVGKLARSGGRVRNRNADALTLHSPTVTNLVMLTVKHRPLTVHDYMQLPEDSGKKIKVRDVFAD